MPGSGEKAGLLHKLRNNKNGNISMGYEKNDFIV